MSSVFFVGWELWEEMTFVLGVSIVMVFCAGLFKLWWLNRRVRKQEILDEEKKARLTEMRKTGLPTKKRDEIPFGVRALQSGVEVEGIWISRPSSPSRSSSKLKLQAVSSVAETEETEKPKKKHLSDGSHRTSSKLSSHRAPSSFSAPDSSADTDASEPKAHRPSSGQQQAQHRQHLQARVLSEEALRRLDGQTSPRPQLLTYVPTTRYSPPNSAGLSPQKHASTKERDPTISSRSDSFGSSRSRHESSSSQRSYAEAGDEVRQGHAMRPQGYPERERRSYSSTPHAQQQTRFSPAPQAGSHASYPPQYQAQQQPLTAPTYRMTSPQPTHVPGYMYADKSARRVNGGFEVLPAGTFGFSHLQEPAGGSSNNADDEYDDETGRGPSGRRLRKKSSPRDQ